VRAREAGGGEVLDNFGGVLEGGKRGGDVFIGVMNAKKEVDDGPEVFEGNTRGEPRRRGNGEEGVAGDVCGNTLEGRADG